MQSLLRGRESVGRVIYKICDAVGWREAERSGIFHGAGIDAQDGYIHFSGPDQVAETAAKHFAGLAGLMLVAVDAAALGPALKWEPSRGGALFPHLYGALGLDAVLWAKPLPLGADGRHVFPELPS
jgi:uncharacterized protein (DUF952 family)